MIHPRFRFRKNVTLAALTYDTFTLRDSASGIQSNIAFSQALKPRDRQETYILSKLKKKKNDRKSSRRCRLDITGDSSAMRLRFTQTQRFPADLRRLQVRYQNSETGKTHSRSTTRKAMLSRIATYQNARTSNEALSPKVTRDIKNFIEGRDGGSTMKYQWHDVVTSDRPVVNEKVTIKIKTGFLKKAYYDIDTLPAQAIYALPELDPPTCTEFDRFFHRKQSQGWGIQNLRYQPFRLSNRKIIRKSFEVFFDKNSSDARAEDLQPIIAYLKDNNLSILQIRIEGYSSIEGDSLANDVLHQKRAQQLVRLLQQYNNEPVGTHTVMTSEAWSPFRELIRNSPFRALDTLQNDTIRELINNDNKLRSDLEPYLKQLRKARLSITLSSRYTGPELVDRLIREFNISSRELAPTRTSAHALRNVEARLAGMIRYMDELIGIGGASDEDLARMVDQCAFPEQARILLFYHEIKKNERLTDGTIDSAFTNRNWNNLFEVAHNNIIALIQGIGGTPDRTRRFRQASDIQYYTIQYIRQGVLDADVLCSIVYPDGPEFYGLKLNHYAIAHELSDRFHFACFGGRSKSNRKTIALTEEEDRTRIENMLSAPRDATQPSGKRVPSFDYSAKGDYYYFLQTLLVRGDPRIRDFVVTSDNYGEFDLFTFLRTNITAWDPMINHFYDSAVQLKELNRLVGQLKKMDQRICTEQVSQLYLDFHLKALHYLNTNFTPGSKQDAAIAEASLNYISDYYTRRVSRLFPKLTIYLCDGLNSFSGLPTRISAPEYAARIISKLAKITVLTDEENIRWKTYNRLINGVNPELKAAKNTTDALKLNEAL